MDKRHAVLSLLEEGGEQEYIPAGFFLHFDKSYQQGRPAIDKHLEYYRHTGMDFVKIQYETVFPRRPEIKRPEDWSKMPLYEKDFYENQLAIAEGLIKAAKKEALVIMTLYSPFMCAGHTAGPDMILEHIRQDPEKTKRGMEIITESLMLFVKACIGLGIDGFYTSTQGGEAYRLGGNPLFDECIKPFDLALMEEINRRCLFNVLHVCDINGKYDDLTPFLDYPGHVVNYGLELGPERISGAEISRMFKRPFMGGLDRKGVLVSGSENEIRQAVEDLLSRRPERFILGADCTLPKDTPWDNLRTAISAAHEYSGRS